MLSKNLGCNNCIGVEIYTCERKEIVVVQKGKSNFNASTTQHWPMWQEPFEEYFAYENVVRHRAIRSFTSPSCLVTGCRLPKKGMTPARMLPAAESTLERLTSRGCLLTLLLHSWTSSPSWQGWLGITFFVMHVTSSILASSLWLWDQA